MELEQSKYSMLSEQQKNNFLNALKKYRNKRYETDDEYREYIKGIQKEKMKDLYNNNPDYRKQKIEKVKANTQRKKMFNNIAIEV